MDWVPCTRQATFTATVLSTAAIVAVIVGLPIMHMHVQRVTSAMLSEVELCKVRRPQPKPHILKPETEFGSGRVTRYLEADVIFKARGYSHETPIFL